LATRWQMHCFLCIYKWKFVAFARQRVSLRKYKRQVYPIILDLGLTWLPAGYEVIVNFTFFGTNMHKVTHFMWYTPATKCSIAYFTLLYCSLSNCKSLSSASETRNDDHNWDLTNSVTGVNRLEWVCLSERMFWQVVNLEVYCCLSAEYPDSYISRAVI
jgi:hypothetical protein